MKALEALLIGTLGPAAVALAIVGAALGTVIGVLLIVDSARVLRWNERLSRWISTRAASDALDRPRDIKPMIYRGHRVFGLFVVAGSLYTLDALKFDFDAQGLARAFRDLGNQSLLTLVFEAVRAFLLVGNLAALGAGIVLCFRPSVLKGLESWADRSFRSPAAQLDTDAMRYEPDQWVGAHPRLAGALVLLGSAYVLFQLAIRPLL
jgi:hypothetical protein